MLTPLEVRTILEVHERYWDAVRDDMRLYKRLYMTKFWDPAHARYTSGVLRTQVSRAY